MRVERLLTPTGELRSEALEALQPQTREWGGGAETPAAPKERNRCNGLSMRPRKEVVKIHEIGETGPRFHPSGVGSSALRMPAEE